MAKSKLPCHDFYVYAWFRPDGTPFYIGKGRRGRINTLRDRNPEFLALVAKYDDLPRSKLYENLSEREAFGIEIDLIAEYGRVEFGGTLVNMTEGGDGPAWTAEMCAKMKAIKDAGYALEREAGIVRRRSPETRARMKVAAEAREARRKAEGIVVAFSDEVKSKMKAVKQAAAARNREAGIVYRHTDEARAVMRAERKTRPPRSVAARAACKAGQIACRARERAAGIVRVVADETRSKMKAAWVIRRAREIAR